ncbi:hypothetical protein [Arsenophonus nasoniae]|uniref:hypothetical protein n=1 Tax=Arsenophonus nasoniae TaxID=638 RepID=UPI00387A317F
MKSINKDTPQFTLPSMITTDVAITLSGKSKALFYYAKRFDHSFPQGVLMQHNGRSRVMYPTAEICQYFQKVGA